jgi:oxaloacetate decarboxylase alpha subunit
VAERVLSLPRVEGLRHLEPLHLEGARARFGRGISDEELLLRLTMPAEQVDAMLASGPATPAVSAGSSGRHPVVTLLRELARRPTVTQLRVRKGDELVEWRRAT